MLRVRASSPRPSTFLSEHYGAPVMLFALLLGMAMNFLSGEGPAQPASSSPRATVLRIGVALLGLRITVGQIADARLAAGGDRRGVGRADDRACRCWSRRLMGFQTLFGLLSGGATAICGASAALALAARAAGPSAEGARDAVHRGRRVGAVDAWR